MKWDVMKTYFDKNSLEKSYLEAIEKEDYETANKIKEQLKNL